MIQTLLFMNFFNMKYDLNKKYDMFSYFLSNIFNYYNLFCFFNISISFLTLMNFLIRLYRRLTNSRISTWNYTTLKISTWSKTIPRIIIWSQTTLRIFRLMFNHFRSLFMLKVIILISLHICINDNQYSCFTQYLV